MIRDTDKQPTRIDPCLRCGALNFRKAGEPIPEKCPKCGGPVMGPNGQPR